MRRNKQRGNGDMDNNNKLPKIIKGDKKDIEDLLKSVMKDYLAQQSNVKIENTKNIHTLTSMVSEFLNAFIIIGYDFKGNPQNLIHAKNQMDADALTAALNKFLFNNQNGNGQEQ